MSEQHVQAVKCTSETGCPGGGHAVFPESSRLGSFNSALQSIHAFKSHHSIPFYYLNYFFALGGSELQARMVIYAQSSLMILTCHYLPVIVAIRVLELARAVKNYDFGAFFVKKHTRTRKLAGVLPEVTRFFVRTLIFFCIVLRTVENVCLPRLVADVLA